MHNRCKNEDAAQRCVQCGESLYFDEKSRPTQRSADLCYDVDSETGDKKLSQRGILIIGAIVAIVSYAVISRAIRQAKIPTFVKKARSIKGAVKSKKDIAESLLYPPKEEFIVKMFGDRWEKLGLSLEDILGLEAKKGKKEDKKSKRIEGGNE